MDSPDNSWKKSKEQSTDSEALASGSRRCFRDGDTVEADLSKISSSATPIGLLPLPVLQSSTPHRSRSRTSVFPISTLLQSWSYAKKRLGTTAPPSESSIVQDNSDSNDVQRKPEWGVDDDDEVDETIVDRSWSQQSSGSLTDPESHSIPPILGMQDNNSFDDKHCGFWASCALLAILRWKLWPGIMAFFSSQFPDKKAEAQYQQENWFLKKPLAMWASVFLIANWVLGCVFIPSPVVLMDQIFYYGIACFLTMPIVLMCAFDLPRDRPHFYQVFLLVSTWSWSFYQVLFIYLCGFYSSKSRHFTCGTKDFLSTFYYTSALQAIALFGLNLKRFPAAIGAVTFVIYSSCLIIPERVSWTRNTINFIIYQAVLLYMHYQRENSNRRLYTLRAQLKIQFKATQRAQVNERTAADSKRRLTSYVFHEVRIPLNTAMLAVQNMEASGKIEEVEFKALSGSLSMMSKVLNDVLDFNRMDSGRLEFLQRPYAFHHVMRSLFVPLKLATNARHLDFVTDLDENIDRVARRAAYEAMGESPAMITKHMEEPSEESTLGTVIGDETRLRQIVTNLASNAVKFTPAGGKLTITTRLISPQVDHMSMRGQDRTPGSEAGDYSLSMHNLNFHNAQHQPLEKIIVRIEVSDTGWGIRSEDMKQSKLFSAFNQTEQGRQQGGKGTGLGLALVRHIVALSGGRLGLKSKVGKGSTFWVELPLGVGPKIMISAGPPAPGTAGPVSPLLTGIVPHPGITPSITAVSMTTDAPIHWEPPSPKPMRSPSALHGLMNQGGSVELVLADQSESPLQLPTESEERPPLEEETSSETVRHVGKTARPTYISLPSPRSFSLDLAASVPSSASTLAHSTSPQETSPGTFEAPSGRILVVDDDALTRTLMKRMLTRMGHAVDTAENGEIALQMILGSTPSSVHSGPILERSEIINPKGKYAIIFLDNQMPVLSGPETVARLRALGRDDFICGVTGNALLTDQNEYLAAGVNHVLTKPVMERSLKAMLTLADEQVKTELPAIQDTSQPG